MQVDFRNQTKNPIPSVVRNPSPTSCGSDIEYATLAAVPSPNCSNCMARLVVLYFMNLPSLQLLELNTYEELLVENRTAQELI